MPRKVTAKERKSERLFIVVSKDERRKLEENARLSGLSLSAFIRVSALKGITITG